MTQPLQPAETLEGASEPWRPERRFVPVRAEDLAAQLCRDADRFGLDEASLRAVLGQVRVAIEGETASFERDLEQVYARFNPDRETVPPDCPAQTEPAAYDALHRQLSYLLDKANFERLDDVRIAEVVKRANTARIHVRIDPSRVERLELWVRGHGEQLGRQRTIRCPIRGAEVRTPVFKRLAVIAQLKGEDNILIKLFKDIPEHDVEALLPHAEAAMTLLDRVKLLTTGVGALGATLLKLTKVVLALAMLSRIMWILAVGIGAMALRTFFGYKHAKTTRDWRRTQRLYFQNLGNNASALHLLLAAVKQEELKEAYLAYALSLNAPSTLTEHGLRSRVEEYLAERWGVGVDFDCPDAVETMTRLDLWRPGRTLQARPAADALQRLMQRLQEKPESDYHARAIRVFHAAESQDADPEPLGSQPRRKLS